MSLNIYRTEKIKDFISSLRNIEKMELDDVGDENFWENYYHIRPA